MIPGIKGFAIYGAALAASLALFYWLPQVDLFVSGLFYDPVHGFTLASWPPLQDFTRSIRWIAWAIVLVALVSAAWLRLVGRPLWRFDRKRQLVDLAGELERHLVIVVIHRRAGVRPDVERLVPRQC